MPMHSGYEQTQDFDIRTIYIVLLSLILILVLIANLLVIITLYRGGLQTCNIPLRVRSLSIAVKMLRTDNFNVN